MTKKLVAPPFIPLGFKDGIHYFYLKKDGEIFKTSLFSIIHLLNLDSRANWQKRFPDRDFKKPSAHRFNAVDVADDLITKSKIIGLFDPNRVRGNGAWQDAGRIVINCGNILIVDGMRVDLADFKSKYVYVKSLKEMPDLNIPLNTKDTKLILDTAKVFKWSRECDAYFLAGWLMLAPIAGALPVRPHIWLTGKKGMGKSTVFENFVTKLLGDIALAGVGPSTEAGIRQAAQHGAQPFIHDEFEAIDQKSMERIGKIVEFLRSCWSDTAARTFKGTAAGTHLSYNARLTAFVTGINVYLPTEADRSRFTIIELQNHANDPEQRVKDNTIIWEHLNKIPIDCYQRLYTRAVSMIKPIIASYQILAEVISAELSSREGQQLGMLLAGYWAFEHNHVINKKEAKELFLKINMSMEADKDCGDSISDEDECLNVLLTYRIKFVRDAQIGYVEDLVGNMIHDANCASVLLSYGIKVNTAKDTFAIAYHHSELSKIYRGTRWEQSAIRIRALARIEGAKRQGSLTFGSRSIKEKSIALPRNAKRRSTQKRVDHINLVDPIVDVKF